MKISHRLTRNQQAVTGVGQLNPTQIHWRSTLASGRWAPTEYLSTINTACQMKVHPDGTVDLIRLEAGLDGWQDLGGQGGIDSIAGRI